MQTNDRWKVKSDGLEIVAESVGRGRPIIFAHGLTSNRTRSLRQLEPLRSDFRIVVFDQRGHADSSAVTDPALYTVERMAGDIGAVMDAAGIRRAIVGGESLGAATALKFALAHPARVESLVLAAPALGDEPNPGRQMLKDMAEAIRRQGIRQFAESALKDLLAGGAPAEFADQWAQVLRSHQQASLAVACEAISDWVIVQSMAELRSLIMPALIIAYENDLIHPAALARRMQQAIPDCKLVLKPSFNAYVGDGQLVARQCREFLATGGIGE